MAAKAGTSVFSAGQTNSIIAAMLRLNCSRADFVSGP
jgi:hypothetical protein